MCDSETREKLDKIQAGLNEIKIWCAKRDETIIQHQRAIELLMTKAEKEISLSLKNHEDLRDCYQQLSKRFDDFQINDYVPFKTSVLVTITVVSSVVGFVGILIGSVLTYFLR